MDVEKCEKLAGNMEMDEIESSAQENKVEIGGEKRHREDFSSEQFKIEVNNLGRFSYGELKKMLKNKLNLNPVKIKNPNRFKCKDNAFLCFRTEVEKEEALKILDGYQWKSRTLRAKVAKAVMDPLLKKRLENQASENDGIVTKEKKKTALEATAPLAHLPYDEQLKQKESECIRYLQSYATAVKKQNFQLKRIIQKNEAEFNGVPCLWHGFKKSPKTEGYRNKTEFAIGRDASGEKVVGFRLGSYTDGTVEVAAPDDVPLVPERTKAAAKLFQQYIQASKYEIFCPEFYTGQFRQLAVRLSETTNEIMLIIGIHTKEVLDELSSLVADIVDYFTQREGKSLNVNSIYIEEMNKLEIGQRWNRMDHVYGSKYITDMISGLKFRISAASFFQINTQAAEVLYDTAIKMGRVDKDTTMLDICCGTGTIGLCFSKHCKEVLGVEIVEEAINDAKFNAENNGITNCKFYAGNCDDYIHSLVYEAKNENLLAVIDPPRAGLQSRSKEAIRNARGLNRFVYIACSPKAALKNWIDFSRPCSQTLKGEPFILKEAAAVDMFPHTNHQEMVLFFERIVDDKPTDAKAMPKDNEGNGKESVDATPAVEGEEKMQ